MRVTVACGSLGESCADGGGPMANPCDAGHCADGHAPYPPTVLKVCEPIEQFDLSGVSTQCTSDYGSGTGVSACPTVDYPQCVGYKVGKQPGTCWSVCRKPVHEDKFTGSHQYG